MSEHGAETREMEVIRRVLAAFADGEVDTEALYFRKTPTMSVFINCNDTFDYACADCEPVTEENVDEFERAMADCMAAGDDFGEHGPLLFIARQRKRLPLRSVLERIEEPSRSLFEAISLNDVVSDSNVMTGTRTRSWRRPRNVVTYFGGYASAILEGNRRVHILRDGDLETFCGLAARLSFGTPRIVAQAQRVSCEDCFREAQEVRRDV